jgi:predicted NodU family carbamoyl transferase
LPQFLFGEHHESHAASAFFPPRTTRPQCCAWMASESGRPRLLGLGKAML